MTEGRGLRTFRVPKPPGVTPDFLAQQLREAAARRDYAAIDSITDQLARMGLCRPRSDDRRTTR